MSTPSAAHSAPPPIDSLDDWISALARPLTLVELLAVVLCGVVAWAAVLGLRRALGNQDERSIAFGKRQIDGVLFPLAWLLLTFVAREVGSRYGQVVVLSLAVPMLAALLAIRSGVKVLQAVFSQARWVRLAEQTLSWLVWIVLALWVSGFLPVVLDELDAISWKVGSSHMSLGMVLEGLATVSVVLIVTLWLSAVIEARLLRAATGAELSLRLALSNAARAVLVLIGVMISLSAVGIDLTALSVLGGAVGVGIGLGLQKLAANYVSGFVILTERSMRIGDNVRVDGFEGAITQINARYTVIRSVTGRESIVPNEMLITSRVENLALSDSRVYQSTQVAVGYASDVDVVQRLLLEAARAQERVLPEPAPTVQLLNFGADGLEFTLGYWINDPENGQGNVRSDINLAILAALRAHQIDIPYPQRVVHTAPSAPRA